MNIYLNQIHVHKKFLSPLFITTKVDNAPIYYQHVCYECIRLYDLQVNFFLSDMYSASSISSNKTGTDMASVLQERLSKAVKDEVPGTGP